MSEEREKTIRDFYPNAECPDCGMPIPEHADGGDECQTCGHIFWHDHEQPSTTIQVIVSDFGIVYTGPDRHHAEAVYQDYVAKSQNQWDQAYNKSVTLLKNGRPDPSFIFSPNSSENEVAHGFHDHNTRTREEDFDGQNAAS